MCMISTKRVMFTFQKVTTEALLAARMKQRAMWVKRFVETMGKILQGTSASG